MNTHCVQEENHTGGLPKARSCLNHVAGEGRAAAASQLDKEIGPVLGHCISTPYLNFLTSELSALFLTDQVCPLHFSQLEVFLLHLPVCL